MAKFALLIHRFKGIAQFPLFCLHFSGVVSAPLVVEPDEMEEAVDEKTPHFTGTRLAEVLRLPRGEGEVDDDVAEEDFPGAADLLQAFMDWKGEHVGRAVDSPVSPVELPHPPVVDQEDPELRPRQVNRREEFL